MCYSMRIPSRLTKRAELILGRYQNHKLFPDISAVSYLDPKTAGKGVDRRWSANRMWMRRGGSYQPGEILRSCQPVAAGVKALLSVMERLSRRRFRYRRTTNLTVYIPLSFRPLCINRIDVNQRYRIKGSTDTSSLWILNWLMKVNSSCPIK